MVLVMENKLKNFFGNLRKNPEREKKATVCSLLDECIKLLRENNEIIVKRQKPKNDGLYGIYVDDLFAVGTKEGLCSIFELKLWHYLYLGNYVYHLSLRCKDDRYEGDSLRERFRLIKLYDLCEEKVATSDIDTAQLAKKAEEKKLRENIRFVRQYVR